LLQMLFKLFHSLRNYTFLAISTDKFAKFASSKQ